MEGKIYSPAGLPSGLNKIPQRWMAHVSKAESVIGASVWGGGHLFATPMSRWSQLSFGQPAAKHTIKISGMVASSSAVVFWTTSRSVNCPKTGSSQFFNIFICIYLCPLFYVIQLHSFRSFLCCSRFQFTF